MNILGQIYEGKEKRLFKIDDPSKYLVEYKDSMTFFGLRNGAYSRGAMNNKVTNHFMRMLEKEGIATHYVEEISERETVVKKLRIFPIEVIVRNVAAGSLARRFGLREGSRLNKTILEFSYKDEKLGDPFVNAYHIAAMSLCTEEELAYMEKTALRVNEILSAYMEKIGITLVDFKLEFGKDDEGNIILADEISPETCRLWDLKSGEKLDKERFRRNSDDEDAYEQIILRLTGKKI